MCGSIALFVFRRVREDAFDGLITPPPRRARRRRRAISTRPPPRSYSTPGAKVAKVSPISDPRHPSSAAPCVPPSRAPTKRSRPSSGPCGKQPRTPPSATNAGRTRRRRRRRRHRPPPPLPPPPPPTRPSRRRASYARRTGARCARSRFLFSPSSSPAFGARLRRLDSNPETLGPPPYRRRSPRRCRTRRRARHRARCPPRTARSRRTAKA
mmetsp:Transcript_8662/g.36284  ORF Transcript_8662/g.36284 Transcript_8662/m.36284 type:complete len:211 (+) Transcript_8662:801-1433(+)